MNENMNNPAEQTEKTFTQDEVNRIVQERLARVKSSGTIEDPATGNKTETPAPQNDFAVKEAELQRRELLISAKESFIDSGLPLELMEAINVSNKEALEKSLDILTKHYKKEESQPPSGFRIGAGSSNIQPESSDPVKAAMGLNRS